MKESIKVLEDRIYGKKDKKKEKLKKESIKDKIELNKEVVDYQLE